MMMVGNDYEVVQSLLEGLPGPLSSLPILLRNGLSTIVKSVSTIVRRTGAIVKSAGTIAQWT
ncbi:MAG: hypothetical protein ACOYOA_11945 [Saprospiraceae bacterium]